MNTGKCPHCGSVVSEVRTEHVIIGTASSEKWHGVSYVCPHFSCGRVISVQIDPVAIRGDIQVHISNAVAPAVKEMNRLKSDIDDLARLVKSLRK